jgi:hypothetical protein
VIECQKHKQLQLEAAVQRKARIEPHPRYMRRAACTHMAITAQEHLGMLAAGMETKHMTAAAST